MVAWLLVPKAEDSNVSMNSSWVPDQQDRQNRGVMQDGYFDVCWWGEERSRHPSGWVSNGETDFNSTMSWQAVQDLSALPKTGRRLRKWSTELQDIAYREMKKFFPFSPLNLRVWPAWRVLIAHTPPLGWSASQDLQCPREDLRGCYTHPALPRKKPLAPWESDLRLSPVSFQHSLDWCGDTGQVISA